MAFEFKDLGLGEIDSGIIVTESEKLDPFKRLGRELGYLPLQGAVVTSLSGIEAQGLGEGESKRSSGSAAGVKIGSNKIQVSTIHTEEFFAHREGLVEVIFEQFPSAIAKKSALYTAGLATLPTEWNNYGTFADSAIAAQTIGTGEESSVDFDDALALLADGVVNGAVFSTAMLSYLKRQRNSVSGTRVFDVEGDYNGGTIDGIRYETFTSQTALGFVGNFDNYVYGAQVFASPITGESFKIITSGTEKDWNGVDVNLNNEDRIALRYEQLIGSAIADTDSFVKITPAVVEGE